jgi:hypothetical protein
MIGKGPADAVSLPKLGTKAETLESLRPLLTQGVIPELMYFTVAQWAKEETALLKKIAKHFGEQQVAVRSSALAEDSAQESHAGAFRSYLAIPAHEPDALREAVGGVVTSMTGNPRDQILVQSMLADVAVSGVIMTYDMTHGAPYYVINYDDESGRTDLVTGGNGLNKGLYVYRNAEPGLIRSPRIRRFLKLARELESLSRHPALDIEFAMNHAGDLFLLQVRRIALSRTWHPNTERRVARQLVFVDQFVQDRSKPRPGLLGSSTILAVMPDWNPAEMIGTTPRPLAASLYRELITQGVWREARAVLGYRRMPAEELMVMINNHPYIDVRNSFNSFLPEGIADEDGEALVDAWIARLAAQPELHDRIEFDIVPTCLDFCFDQDFKARYKGLLPPRRLATYKCLLGGITRSCVARDGTLTAALDLSRQLAQSLATAPRAESGYGWLVQAARLIDRCKQQGTLPFAIVARHAFIAEALLRSAVRRGALTEERLAAFRRTLQTVTSTMVAEYADIANGRGNRHQFLTKYGHLRPGTYEITSRRYDERDDLFLDLPPELPPAAAERFTLTMAERRAIDKLIGEAELTARNADDLFAYARLAITGREEVKFIFSRALSDALSSIVRWGAAQGLSRDDLSFIDWPSIEKCLAFAELDDADRRLFDMAQEGRRSIDASHAFRLGHIICGTRDVYVATINRSVPNFIGTGHASGPVAELVPATSATVGIDGHIVCIENADPGFDWIFTKRPIALITKFGGTNSHMAIRCAEFGLPAAIGCGEQIYNRIAAAGTVELSCAEKILRPIHGN